MTRMPSAPRWQGIAAAATRRMEASSKISSNDPAGFALRILLQQGRDLSRIGIVNGAQRPSRLDQAAALVIDVAVVKGHCREAKLFSGEG